jgi:hypothetical protein
LKDGYKTQYYRKSNETDRDMQKERAPEMRRRAASQVNSMYHYCGALMSFAKHSKILEKLMDFVWDGRRGDDRLGQHQEMRLE